LILQDYFKNSLAQWGACWLIFGPMLGRRTQCVTWATARLARVVLKIDEDAGIKAGKNNIAS